MNILFCQYDSICENGIIRGFKQLGHHLFFLERPLEHPDTDSAYIKLVSNYLFAQKINFVFSVNFIPLLSQVCQIHQIPYVCWIVDSPIIQLYSDTLSNPVNYVFLFDYTQYEEFHSKNPGHIFYLPLGCDLELWNQINITPEDHKKYDCDISFVGSLYTEKCDYNRISDNFSPHLKGYFEGIMTAQRNIYGYNFLKDVLTDEIMKEYISVANVQYLNNYTVEPRTILGNLILNAKCTEMERIHLLNSIAQQFSLDLYTQSDTSSLKGVNCRGIASSTDGMPKVFKCSKINLNLTAKGIQTGASLRIFDILGCKAFLISNYQMELPELFEAGKDLVLFESEKDLLEKISYYLSHDEERQEIANHGYQKIQDYYSYKNRLECMLDMLPF